MFSHQEVELFDRIWRIQKLMSEKKKKKLMSGPVSIYLSAYGSGYRLSDVSPAPCLPTVMTMN